MSDTLSGTTHPDDNDDHPWWGLPCTVTPCFGARLVQEGNRLHYLADRAGIRGLFSDADAYHLDQAFPLLMKQLELMLTSGELNTDVICSTSIRRILAVRKSSLLQIDTIIRHQVSDIS